MNQFDIALIETDGTLQKESLIELLAMIQDSEVLPIKVEALYAECSAIGFIRKKAADEVLNYCFTGLNDYIEEILDDLNKENPQHQYAYKGLSIYMGYERLLQNEKKDVRRSSDDVYVVRVREHLGGDYNVKAASAEDAEAFIRDKYDKGSLTIDTEVIDTDIECTGLAKDMYENVYIDFDATK